MATLDEVRLAVNKVLESAGVVELHGVRSEPNRDYFVVYFSNPNIGDIRVPRSMKRVEIAPLIATALHL